MGDDEMTTGEDSQTQPLTAEDIAELLQQENAESSLDQPSDGTS